MRAEVPYNEALVDRSGILMRFWHDFYRRIYLAVKYLGEEKVDAITNNSASPVNFNGMKFNKSYASCVIIDALVQRVTNSSENVESGIIRCEYLPDSEDWQVSDTFTSVGLTISITSAGQVQYTSTNVAGTVILSRIVYRVRELYGKAFYSKVG